MRKAFVVVVVMGLGILVGLQASSKEDVAGDTVPITVSISPVKKAYRIGEQVYLEMRVDNVGTVPLRIPSAIGIGEGHILLHTIDPSGKAVQWKDQVAVSFQGKIEQTIRLEPATFYGKRSLCASFDREGKYKLSVTFHGPESKTIPSMWHGSTISNEIIVSIRK